MNAIKQDLEKLAKVLVGFNRAPAEAHFLSLFYTGLESCLATSQTSRYHKELLVTAIEKGLILDNHVERIKDVLVFRHFTRTGLR
jgi:hypothetical protein